MPQVELTPDDLYVLNREATVARLLSRLAHDVNNALQVISGTAELLQQRRDVDEATQKGLQRIASQVNVAAATVGEVLAFAQSQPVTQGPVALGTIARKAVSLQDTDLRRADIAVRVDVEAGDVVVVGNATQLLQLVLNLVDNARRALRQVKDGTLTVSVVAERGDAVLRVADNGPGVSAEDHERTFEPFASRNSGGPRGGFGLSVAARLARDHGGSLVVEPASRGATFALRLPRLSA